MTPHDCSDENRAMKTPNQNDQAQYWDRWNARAREAKLPEQSDCQGTEVEAVVAALQRRDLKILDVGCGTGWMCQRLVPYGEVTGTDMTPDTLQRAAQRVPSVQFVCGDIFELDLPQGYFDVVVALEVLAHVPDQPAFVDRLRQLLCTGGQVIVSTQNRPVYERWSSVSPPSPAQVRRWVNHRELRNLLNAGFGGVQVRSLYPVGDRGILRLVNSVKLNRIAATFVKQPQLRRWKESLMLGGTLFATGVRSD